MMSGESQKMLVFVSGPGGCGKTHFVQNILIPALQGAGLSYTYGEGMISPKSKDEDVLIFVTHVPVTHETTQDKEAPCGW